jgi:hypothetical protein
MDDLIHFSAITASFRQSRLTASWFTQMHIAPLTEHNCLGMRKYRGDLKAAWAFNIHEKGIGGLHEAL